MGKRRKAGTAGPSPTAAALVAAARSYPGVADECIPYDAADFDEALASVVVDVLREAGAKGTIDFRCTLLREASAEWLDEGSGKDKSEVRVDLVLVPAIGRPDRIAAFAADPGRRGAVAASVRRHGLFGDGTVTLVPVVIGPETAASPSVVGIRTALRELTDAAVDGNDPSPDAVARIAAAIGGTTGLATGSDGTALRFLVGVACRRWPKRRKSGYEETTDVLYPSIDDDRNDEIEADAADWRRATEGAFGDVEVGAPAHWPEAASDGAARFAKARFATERARLGIPASAETETVRFALSDDGLTTILAEVAGGRTVGPAAMPSGLVTFEGGFFMTRLVGPSLNVDHCGAADILGDVPYAN